MLNKKLISLGFSLLILGGCATATPVAVNTQLSDRLPKDAAISYLEKQRTFFGDDTYGQCVFKHGDVRVVLQKWDLDWEWVNTYEFEDMTLYVSDNPITGREYTLKGNDILIGSGPSTYSEGKECKVMRATTKESPKYAEATDPERASKIVAALQSLGVTYVAQ